MRVRSLSWPLLLALVVASIAAGIAVGGNGDTNNKTFEYSIGLWGDLPYSNGQEAALPNLFADMNNAQLEFTVDDGDLKQGSNSPCDNALYQRALGWFDSLEAPAMFTPGDNDWTDCDRANNGGFNSLERLDHERQVFFSTLYSLGQHPMKQEVQSTPDCLGVGGPTPCVENRRWELKDVVYATFNVQGSCNNLCDTSPDPNEYAKRNAADIAWLQDTFNEAKADNAGAVMLISQGDPGFDGSDATRAPTRDPKTLVENDANASFDGYKDFLTAVRAATIDFRRPVAYVHGDSHYFRIDKPFTDGQGRRLENFTRVETFGDHQENGTNDVQWLKVLVDPHSRDVFAYQPQIVPANRVAVPAP
jgi:hypothetical protein